MVEHIKLIFNGVKNPSRLTWASIYTEETNKFGLEQELSIESILDDEREDLVELFYGSAELEKNR